MLSNSLILISTSRLTSDGMALSHDNNSISSTIRAPLILDIFKNIEKYFE